MKFQPTEEQIDMLANNIQNLIDIGDFTQYPKTPIDPATEFLRDEVFDIVENNSCYGNMLHAMAHLATMCDFTGDEVKYAVGVAVGASGIPTPHAWLKFCGRYYDPSWEKLREHIDPDVRHFATGKLTDYTYYAMAELGHLKLRELLRCTGFMPPCALDVLTHRPELLNKKRGN